MDVVSPINRTLSVFISHHNPELNAAYDAAVRVLTAFPAGRQPDMLDSSSVFVGIFAGDAEVDILTEMDHALRQKKNCLIFVRDLPASQRDPELNDLLYQPPPFCQVYTYRTLRDLSYRLFRALEDQYKQLHHADWQVPVLPLRDPIFAGREDAIQRIYSMLTDAQPIAITGGSGIGKTALARELTYRLRDRFPAGVFWLEPFGKSGQTLQSAFRLIAAAHPGGREAISREQIITGADIRGWLVNVPLRGLVVADDMSDMDALRELDAALPGNFDLVITTAAPSLLDSNWKQFELAALNAEDGFTVLRRMLELPKRLTQDVMRPLQEVASLLGGHPLCLRLAAEWMQRAGGWQSALVYMQRLKESSTLSVTLPPDVETHLGIDVTFSVLYQNLSDNEKRLLRAAGVFVPGFPFPGEGLLEVAQMPGAWREVSALVPSILTPDEASDGFRLHPQISAYARALLAQTGELAGAQSRHLDYYEAQAARYMQPDDEDDCIIGTGQPRHAFFHARDNMPHRLVQYVLTAGQYLQLIGEDEELRDWLTRVINADARSIVPPEYGDDRWTLPTNLRGLGDLALRIRQNHLAEEYYQRALLLYYENRSLSGQANTLKSLADLRAAEGKFEDAREIYDRTLELYAQIDFQLGRANTLKSMGELSLQSGDIHRARRHFNDALALYEQIEFQLGQAHTLRALGDLAMVEHDLTAAGNHYGLALSYYREINFQSQEASILLQIGDLHVTTGAIDAAHLNFEESLYIYRELKDEMGQAQALEALGRLQVTLEHFNNARFAYENAAKLYRNQEAHAHAADILVRLAPVYLHLAQPESALLSLLQALKMFHQIGDRARIENTQREMREAARQIGSGFPVIWTKVTDDSPLPEWLKLAPAPTLPQQLVYAVRDFILADSLDMSQRILEAHQEIMLTDAADEVFARMLRQYAGQPGQTRQIDRYRELLQRCRQIGIASAFSEFKSPALKEENQQVRHLQQTLDAYDEALERLRDIPLVYASIQINRAGTLRDLARHPGQDRLALLHEALEAYDEALANQETAPHELAQTQIIRAETLNELARLPDADMKTLLQSMLVAYDEALAHQQDDPAAMIYTQLQRADTLHQLAHIGGGDMLALMQEALAAYEEVLIHLEDKPLEYAQTQSSRALVLYEMAGLPGQDFQHRMQEALRAYDEALEFLRDDDPLGYARTENHRVALLRDMAGLPGEDRTARLYQALAACNEALRFLLSEPLDYAHTQINRAHLLREIAGLTGEHRLARMREALATYNEALGYLAERPLDYASVQNSRAALLREMAGISGENTGRRLHESMEAAAESLIILNQLDSEGTQLRNARRMMVNTHKEVLKYASETVFVEWWHETVGTPIPDWLTQ